VSLGDGGIRVVTGATARLDGRSDWCRRRTFVHGLRIAACEGRFDPIGEYVAMPGCLFV
jgi:hypothetical protein